MSFFGIGLHKPKHTINIGSTLRAATVYGSSFVAVSGKRYKRCSADVFSSYSKIPLFSIDNLKDVIPFDCVPVAIDLVEGARPLHTYNHPRRAFYIFGPEDGTLGKSITQWCRDVVYVPTNGCMNLAATVNVVLYDRMAKNMSLTKE